MTTSPYDIFRERAADANREPVVTDHDGFPLYEDGYSSLLFSILEENDTAMLAQYLSNDHGRGRWFLSRSDIDDPFCVACRNGSTESLKMLLEYWYSHDELLSRRDNPLEDRSFGFLHTACCGGHIETVRYLLDCPWTAILADIRSRSGCYTPILCAADFASRHVTTRAEFVARGEELMGLLLDMGASADDTLLVCGVVEDTVLSLAVTWASAALVERLLDEGAELEGKVVYRTVAGECGLAVPEVIEGVTAVHIASRYANIDALSVLLSREKRDAEEREGDGHGHMVIEKDSTSCLPLHWATSAMGPLSFNSEYPLLESEESFVPRITATVQLLLDLAPDTINTPAYCGSTALHYAVRMQQPRPVALAVAQVLCNHGADASIRNNDGATPLHVMLRFHARDSGVCNDSLVDLALVDLLTMKGAPINAQDNEGNAALHYAARNVWQAEAAGHLLSKGADVRVVNAKGNTPLHEAAGLGIGARTRAFRAKTAQEKAKAQDAMLKVLLVGLSSDEAEDLLGLRNGDGRSVRQLAQETRNSWKADEEQKNMPPVGRGRGRASRC